MSGRRIRPALVLAAWSMLVWTTRIRNIWTDDQLTVTGQLGRTALAGSFTVFAVATIVSWRRGTSARRLLEAFAAWTIGVWAVRGVQIALADHAVAFVVVHTVLAIVSIALAVWVLRDVRRSAVADLVSDPTPDAVH